MKIFYYKHQLAKHLKTLKNEQKTIGFAPTMGALHEGHISLILAAKKHCDLTISSIFVNPKQFDKSEDLLKYPRSEEQDLEKLAQAGCDLVYIPQADDLYDAYYTAIPLNIGSLAAVYEGEKRTGHFEGVVQVLYQLFKTIEPNAVFFGQKDFQQCLVVQKLVSTYFSAIQMHTVPTLRSPEGLALSSRNARLSTNGLKTAVHLNKSLTQALNQFDEKNPAEALANAHGYLTQNGFKVEYLDFADAKDLTPHSLWTNTPTQITVVCAAFIEGIRLIDNKTRLLKALED